LTEEAVKRYPKGAGNRERKGTTDSNASGAGYIYMQKNKNNDTTS
jgi:hypothetical protein